MKLAATYKDIRLMAPDDAMLSFFKSPFAAHETGSAVDIAYEDFSEGALSPVDGVVVDIRKFNTPTPFKNRDFKEYLTAIRCGEFIVKILHVKPDVEIGERIRCGEEFGTFIKSGYFYFWNFSHLHVEIRMPDDYLRASNNMPLDIPVGAVSSPKDNVGVGVNGVFEFCGEVVFSDERYALVDCPNYSSGGDLNGYAANGYLLDGFIPADEHALHRFGLIGNSNNELPFDSYRLIGNSHMVHSSGVDLGVFDKEYHRLPVAGASFIMFFGNPLIKLIPTLYGECLPQCGEQVCVQIKKIRLDQ